MTPFTETKLYSYMFVLCLFVDNFVTEFTELAKDLSMDPSKCAPPLSPPPPSLVCLASLN